VRKGVVVGRGYHHRAGLPHGEIEALSDAGERARGATLYVTLEPCAHHGRTPPCTDALIAAGVARVVFGMQDPNPTVVGHGREILQRAGVKVVGGVEANACAELNAPFAKLVTTGLPLVTVKLAASLDGRIATRNGDSQWITTEKSRRFVHQLRNRNDAVMVGANTVIEDDPQLTARLRGARDPLRVVIDGRLRLPLSAQVVQDSRCTPTIVVTTRNASARKVAQLEARGVEVWRLPVSSAAAKRTQPTAIDLRQVMRSLGERGLLSVLIEGGATLAAAALTAGVVDRLLLFYGPRLIGGDGRPMLASLGVESLQQALQLGTLQVRRFAGDLVVATEMVSR
jgi:diaminohydroxyphosphoribosylaminopyrimidine deaminase/5-amino-6-(5-phosphoribosylamino)uracil reductase